MRVNGFGGKGMAALLAVAAVGLAGCGGDDSSDDSTAASTQEQTSAASAAPAADLSGVQDYLNTNTAALTEWTGRMDAAAQEYLTLAEGANRDYAQLLEDKPEETQAAVTNLRELWVDGNPLYERMEGIVAGVPSLRRVRRHHRRRLERAGRSRERRAVRPDLPDGSTSSSSPAPSTTSPRARSGARSPTTSRSRPRSTSTATATTAFGEVLPDAGVPRRGGRASSTATPRSCRTRRRRGSRPRATRSRRWS